MKSPDSLWDNIIARMTMRLALHSPSEATRHLLHDIQMGQATTAAEFAEIERAERHVPTAEERAGYERFVRETMEFRR